MDAVRTLPPTVQTLQELETLHLNRSYPPPGPIGRADPQSHRGIPASGKADRRNYRTALPGNHCGSFAGGSAAGWNEGRKNGDRASRKRP